MEINRDKNGTLYWTDYIDGQRVKRQSKKWKTKREARENYELFMQQYKDNEVDLHNIGFNRLIEEYINFISLSQKQSTVLRQKQRLENQLAPFFKDRKVRSINKSEIMKYQNYLLNFTYKYNGQDKHYGTRQLEIMQSTLRSLLDFAYKFEYIDRNPFDQVPFVKRQVYEPKRKVTILSLEQYREFRKYIDDIVYEALFDVLYWCGLRIGELLALEIKDFDGHNLHVYKNYDTKNRVITTTKTSHERTVSVPDTCIASLNKLINSYKKSEGKSFSKNRPLFAYDDIIPKTNLDRDKNKIIKSAQEDGADIPYFTFHELRHTHVSTLISLGMESKDIADRLGHSVEMVNNTYGHLFPERKDKLLEKLNSL